MHIRKGDEVIVLAGKQRGRRGTVLKVIKDMQKIVVEGVNMAKRHTKGNPEKGVAGGILEKEMPLHISNVAIFNPLQGKADRIGVKHLEDGKKVRFFRSNGEIIDV